MSAVAGHQRTPLNLLNLEKLEQFKHAPVAQLDRASDFESEGRGFESLRARREDPLGERVSNDSEEIPRHPAASIGRNYLVAAAIMGVLAIAAVVASHVWLASSLLLLAGFFGWISLAIMRDLLPVQLHNLAYERITRGQFSEAEALLARIPSSLGGGVARGIRRTRSLLALQRGDLTRAVAEATSAIEGSPSLLSRQAELVTIVLARSYRSFAHAALDQQDLAQEDAVAVEQATWATPAALARVALARAVVLARQGDLVALAGQLSRARGLILEQLTPRERALFRALRRQAAGRSQGVYREPPRPDDAEEENVGTWITRLVPGAAAHVGDVNAREPSGTERDRRGEPRRRHEGGARPRGGPHRGQGHRAEARPARAGAVGAAHRDFSGDLDRARPARRLAPAAEPGAR